ncbi:MAG: helix-turn-helix transcriptional regulator [Candidatus Harrisonbacteria bacterium]|nr:helix-turn-helix transcriptional regulator [Candidatus Harrisonbacteria bacterium]
MTKNQNTKIKFRSFEDILKEQYPTKKARAKADERFHRLALGYEIYSARKKRGLTQKELAKKMQTTQSEIARIESGEQNVTADKLNKIANSLKGKLKISLV